LEATQVARRLAAILAADVVGYSRLVQQDEAGTIAALKRLRREVLEPLILGHHGRLVQVVGDGLLVEFASVVDAVLCAVAMQEAVAVSQAGVGAERRFLFRIGINLGDVVADGELILGDGVNVAARLEQLCEPGGVLVSETVREHVGNKLAVVFEYIGPLSLKNIGRPVGAHRVQPPGAADYRPPPPVVDPPAKPSVAVLPFINLTGDPDQDFFCEGIAEDLITELSKVSGLFVAARQSTFARSGDARDAAEACALLRVSYALEGSVRRAGDRVRIAARLVKAQSGGQVWAERYDRTVGDIFAVQDDITRNIVAALEVRLLLAEKEALARPPTANLESYKLYLHGLQQLRQHTRPAYEQARRMFSRAVALDPDFARALTGLAECDCYLYMHGAAPASFDSILELTGRALAIEPTLASAHALRGFALMASGDAEAAELNFRQAIALEPGHPGAHYAYARACVQLGRPEEAVTLLRRAADLAPGDVGYLNTLAALYRALGRGAEAEVATRESLARSERRLAEQPASTLAAFTGARALAALGETERALEWAERALGLGPDDHLTLYNVACAYALLGMRDPAIETLRRAMATASPHRIAWMHQDRDLDPLRDDPRVAALFADGPPPARAAASEPM
jgi:adenylate cyclase